MLCGGASLVKRSESYVHVKPARCRSWTCDVCRPRRQALVEFQIEAGQPDAHVVLTLRRTPGASATGASERLGLYVAEFFRRYQRRTGVHVERYNVRETTKAGWPHVHIACRGWRFGAHKQLCQLWREVTGDSDHVRVRRIPAKRMSRYLAKYLGKDLHKFGNSKRYWRTLGWLPADFGKPSDDDLDRWQGWRFHRDHPEDLARSQEYRGWWRHKLGDGEFVLTPPLWTIEHPRGPP